MLLPVPYHGLRAEATLWWEAHGTMSPARGSRETTPQLPASGGRERGEGWSGKQTCTVMKRRHEKPAKDAGRLGPKGHAFGAGGVSSPTTATKKRRRIDSASPIRAIMWNVGNPSPSHQGKHAVRPAERAVGMRGWKKRRPFCNGRDRDCAARQHHPSAKAGRLPPGLS